MARRDLLVTLGFLAVLVRAPAQGEGLEELARGWEYRWGDLPVAADGSLPWLRPGGADEATDTAPRESSGWFALASPSNPPGRAGRTRLWLRVRLPALEVADARLFVRSIDLAAEFFLDGRLLYRWGDPGAEGRLPFAGWPWHLIELPPGYGSKWLHVRVASDYHDIGLWGDVLLGPGYAQVVRILMRDLPRLLVVTAALLIAAAMLVWHCGRGEPSGLLLAAVAMVLVIRVLARTLAKQFVLDAPLLWQYLELCSPIVAAALVASVLERMLSGRWRRLARAAVSVLSALCALAILAASTGAARICDLYRPLDACLLGSFVVLGGLSLKAARRADSEARLLAMSFGLLGLLAVYGMAVSNSLLPWNDEIDYILLLQFAAGLAVLLGRRVRSLRRGYEELAAKVATQAEQLRLATERFEERVAERTRQLERANRRLREEKISLQITSITDGLTGLYNRTYTLDRLEKELGKARRYGKRLSVIMFDLDHFKEVNDSFGHQAGDLVMQRVGGVLRDMLRESDLAGRYGGEEFLVVLPETDAGEAARVAERIRSEIEAMSWPQSDMHVTISGGVAQFAGESGDKLLQRVDYLLYQAKEGGRNRIVWEEAPAAIPRPPVDS